MIKTHHLKIESRWYERLLFGDKTCELRRNDRDFQVNDEIQWLVLYPKKKDDDGNLYQQESFEAAELFKITHVMPFGVCEGLVAGYCALSLKKLKKAEKLT